MLRVAISSPAYAMPTKFYLKECDSRTGPFTGQELEERYRIHEIDGDTPAQMNLLCGATWEPLRRYFPHFLSTHQASNEQTRRSARASTQNGATQKKESRDEIEEESRVTITCVKCGMLFPLDLLETRRRRYCPACQTEYQSIQAAKQPRVFLVIPSFQQAQGTGYPKHLRKKNLSAQVLEALFILECSTEASFEEVRKAYHKKIKEYHPDKVLDLGKEIRKVAEVKTIELTAAYQVLQRAYSDY